MKRIALACLALAAACRDKPAQVATRPSGAGGDRAEAESLFMDVLIREEAMFAELGNYAGTAELESELWPAPGEPPVVPAAWQSLGVAPPVPPRCRYVVLAGTDLEAVPGLLGQELLGAAIPGRHWWYAIARCGDWVYGRANLSPATRVLRQPR